MCCISKIRRHINGLQEDSLFTTRDMLAYGKRAAVDQSLARLVKRGVIYRLCRGIFLKRWLSEPEMPSPLQVAAVKARAFGKKLAQPGWIAAAALGFVSSRDINDGEIPSNFFQTSRQRHGSEDIYFSTDGASSSFLYAGKRVIFKSVSPRKFAFCDSIIGRFVRAVGALGESRVDRKVLGDVMIRMGREDRRGILANADLLPAWLLNHLNSSCFQRIPQT